MPFINGASTRIRTRDLSITNRLLYQLSYKGMHDIFKDIER